MERSESVKNIGAALVKFNSLVGKIPKDSKNPFFKSNYADLSTILDVINPHLVASDLAVTQFPKGTNELVTMLIHGASGEFIAETYTMRPVKDDPQGLGSSITYQRRYSLAAALSLNIDHDDDGNKASEKPKAQTSQPQPKQPTPPKQLKDSDLQGIFDKGIEKIKETLAVVREGIRATATTEQILNLENKLLELGNIAAAEIPTITPEQLAAALNSTAEKIKSTLNAVAKKKLKISALDKKKLEDKMFELLNVPVDAKE